MRRVLRIMLLGTASLVVLVLTLFALALGALQLSPVRSAVRDELVARINELLPGRLEVGELRVRSLNQVVLEEAVLRNAEGEIVAELERATASVDLVALSAGVVRIEDVRIEGLSVELGRLGSHDHGLLSALPLDGSDEKAATSAGGTSGFPSSIEVPDLSIIDSELTARLGPDHAMRLEVDLLRGSLNIRTAGSVELSIERLRGAVDRNGRTLAKLVAPSELKSDGTGPAELALTGELTWGETVMVDASARIRDLSSATLERAGLPADFLYEPTSFDATAEGTLTSLAFQIEVGYPTAREPRSIAARIDGTLALDETAEPTKTSIEVTIEDARHEGTPLPRIHGVAVFADGAVRVETLRASQGRFQLEARGLLEASGAVRAHAKVSAPDLGGLPIVRELVPELPDDARLTANAHLERDADGTLRAHAELVVGELAFDGFSAERVEVSVTARGDLSAPQLDASVRARGLEVQGQAIETAQLRIEGGPDRYRIRGSAAERRLFLRGSLARHDEAWIASGRLRLRTEPQAVHVHIGWMRVAPGEAITLREVRVAYGRATARLSGTLGLGDERSNLHVAGQVPSLAELAAPFIEPELRGRVAFNVRARGTLDRPQLDASLIYRDGPHFAGAPVRASAEASLDVHEGRARVHITAAAGGGASAELLLNSRSRASLPSVAALEHAEHELEARASDLSIAELIEHVPGGAPSPFDVLDGQVTVRVMARGTISDPLVGLQVDGRMRFDGDAAPFKLRLIQHYDDGLTVLSVKAHDRQGMLLSAGFAGEARRDLFGRGPAHVFQVLRDTQWSAAVDLRSRRLWDLPGARDLDIDPERYPIELGVLAEIEHEPKKEPMGRLDLRAKWQGAGGDAAGCAVLTRLDAQLTANMSGGRLNTELKASIQGGRVISMWTSSSAPIDSWLAPGQMEVGPAQVRVELDRLAIGHVPWLCGHAGGVVSADLFADDLFDERASFSLAAELERFQLRRGPRVDASAHLRTRGEMMEASLNAKIVGGRGEAAISGELPISLRVDKPALCVHEKEPLDLQVALDEMEVQPFLSMLPAVANASGEIDGTVSLAGSLAHPTAEGSLGLSDVSFTLPELGQRFASIDAAIELDGRTIRVPTARFEARDGYAVVSARATLQSADQWHAELDLRSDDFPLNNRGVYVGSVDARAEISARTERDRIDVRASIEDMSVQLITRDLDGVISLEPNPDIQFVHGESESRQVEKGEDALRREVVVSIRTQSPVWVTRDDFALAANADLTVRPEAEGARIAGTIDVVRGKLKLLGQTFSVERGTIRFTGAKEPNPQLELTATADNPGGGTSRVEVTGFVRSPELSFFVDDDPVTAGEALAAMTGRGRANDPSAEASAGEQLSSMALGMTMGMLSLGARRELGEWVPVLSVEQGEDSTRLTAGIEADRIIPKALRGFVRGAYVEGIVSTGDTSARGDEAAASANGASGGVLLELLLPRDLVWAGQYGPGERWSVDLDWRPAP